MRPATRGRSALPAALPEPPPEHNVALAQHLAGGGGGLDAANEHAPLPRLHGMGGAVGRAAVIAIVQRCCDRLLDWQGGQRCRGNVLDCDAALVPHFLW